MTKSKYWCFTLNNYEEKDEQLFRVLAGSDCTYCIFGKEIGRNGTPHLQGYIELKKRVTLVGVRRIHARAHWERRRGSGKEASEYCKKENNFEETGELFVPQNGRRTDLESIRNEICEGKSDRDLADEHFGLWVQYRKSFNAYRALLGKPRMRKGIRVIFIYGDTGVGKSRLAYELFPELYSVSDVSLKWFDGYNGEKEVLFDDYRGACSDEWILKVIDIYPLRVPIKGGFCDFNPEIIIITSNMYPDYMHENVKGPWLRRLTHTWCVTTKLIFPDCIEEYRNKIWN